MIVYRRSEVRAPVNVGPYTGARSFTFAGTQWYCEDEPARSKPELPSVETDGTYGVAPEAAMNSR